MQVYQAIPTFLLIFVDLAFCNFMISFHKRFSPHPIIWLEDYVILSDVYISVKADARFQKHHQFENDFVSKNGSDYVIYPKTHSVTFQCKAKYPVAWTVPHPEQILDWPKYTIDTSEYRSSVATKDKPSNRLFYSWLTLIIQGGDLSSGVNFTCQSVDPKTSFLQSSIYVFRVGPNRILNEWKELHVSVSKDEFFVIPCRSALPNIPILLEKQVQNSTSYTEVQLSPYLSFDPKIGFTMSKRLFGNNTFGMYRCRVNKNDFPSETNSDTDSDSSASYEYVYASVTKSDSETGADDKIEDFKTISRMSGNASVTKNDDYVLCCSGESEVRPDTLEESCYSAGQCLIAKKQFLEKAKDISSFGFRYLWKDRDDCTIVYFSGAANFISCKGGHLDFVEHYQSAFLPNIQNIEKRGNTGSLTHYDTADAISSLSVESKILFSVGKLQEPINAVKAGTNFFYLYGDLQLRPDHLSITKTNAYIQEFDRNHYYEGENLTFTCFALKVFYSAGIQLQLKWKNGTVTSLAQANYVNSRIIFSGYYSLSDFASEIVYHFFSVPVTADLEMESVNCYVPDWKTSEWDVLKYNLDIRLPILPKVETEKDYVYFNLMDTGMQILFNVYGGEPEPMIKVFKDNKIIATSAGIENNETVYLPSAERDENGESDTSDFFSLANMTIEKYTSSDSESVSFIIKIIFLNVTHDIQGTYRCVAESVKGNVTKDIYVFVAVKNSMAWTIVISVTLVLGILLVGIGIWYKLQHKTVQMLRFGIRRL